MENAREEVQTYLDDIQYYIDCLNDQINNAQYEAENIISEWEDSASAYNNR